MEKLIWKWKSWFKNEKVEKQDLKQKNGKNYLNWKNGKNDLKQKNGKKWSKTKKNGKKLFENEKLKKIIWKRNMDQMIQIIYWISFWKIGPDSAIVQIASIRRVNDLTEPGHLIYHMYRFMFVTNYKGICLVTPSTIHTLHLFTSLSTISRNSQLSLERRPTGSANGTPVIISSYYKRDLINRLKLILLLFSFLLLHLCFCRLSSSLFLFLVFIFVFCLHHRFRLPSFPFFLPCHHLPLPCIRLRLLCSHPRHLLLQLIMRLRHKIPHECEKGIRTQKARTKATIKN